MSKKTYEERLKEEYQELEADNEHPCLYCNLSSKSYTGGDDVYWKAIDKEEV